MMLSTSVAQEIADMLVTDDFHDTRHVQVYAQILGILMSGEPLDAKSVAYGLVNRGHMVQVGGSYLHDLLEAPLAVGNGPYHAKRVADLGRRRRIINACIRGTMQARDLDRDVAEVADFVQSAVHAATAYREQSTVSFTDILDETLDQMFNEDGPARGLSTGVGALDDVIGGLKPGQLIVVAGRPGGGKSVLCNDFARAAAIRQVEPVVMFSLEMGRHEVQKRLLSAEAGVDLAHITNGPLSDWERSVLRDRAEKLRGVFIDIDDTAGADLNYIRSTSRKIHAKTGLGLIIVDYLQLVTAPSGVDNRAVAVGEISRGLKILARELGVPVVAAAQINRSSESRQDRRPQLSDLRESGSIEQDADVVVLLHRPDYHNPEDPRAGEIDLIVAKNRNGPIETVTAAAQLQFSRIVDFTV
jgi:replicative DNA helicase